MNRRLGKLDLLTGFDPVTMVEDVCGDFDVENIWGPLDQVQHPLWMTLWSQP